MAGLGLLLSACGGSDAFTTKSDTGTDPGAASVASIILLASTPTLGSSSDAEVQLTAQVKDVNNNLMEGQTVTFSATGGGLQVISGTTDASGMAQAKLSTAGDPTNRTITVTASAGSRSASVDIAVTGTTVSVSGESAVVFGNSIDLTIFLKDSAGNGIPNQTVTVSSANGNTLSASTLTTGPSGSVQVSLTGTVGGTDTITVSALGNTAQYTVDVSSDQFSLGLPGADLAINQNHTITVDWSQGGNPVPDGQTVNFSATRGTLSSSTATTAGGQASVTISSPNAGPVLITAFVDGGPSASTQADFVATTPATLILQAAESTIGPNGQEDAITAVVRDANNNLVKNIPIRFTIVQDNSNGSISNSTDTTDNLGRASTIYTSTDVTTANDGVIVQAEVENRADYEGAGIPCDGSSLCATVAITVAQADLFVRLGASNLLEALSSTQYSKPYSVLVTDAAGNARANVQVKVSLIPTQYGKGYYTLSVDSNGDPTTPWVPVYTAVCQNEDTLIPGPDTELNGILDPGEDINGNGQLDPGNIASVPGTVTTDENGFATIDVIYAKDFANWTEVTLRATAQVAGSEGSHEVTFWLPVLATDLNNKDVAPPGSPSPFGTASTCNDPS